MNRPLATVIITTFKRPKFLKGAITSVLNQTYPHFQLCIYDNASNDETKEIVDAFLKKDSRIHYHCHPENIGMMANYQYALSHVSTPFFSLLSDDDLVLPLFLEKAMKGFEEAPEIGFFIGSTVIISDKGNRISTPILHWQREGKLSSLETIQEMVKKFPPPPSILFRREILDKVQIDISNQLVWDVDFLLQAASHFHTYVSKEELGIFVSHEGSFSGSQLLPDWRIGFDKIYKRFQEKQNISQEIQKVLIDGLLNYQKQFAYGLVSHYFLKKEFKEAYTYAKILNKRYGMKFKNSLIKICAQSCHYFPFLFPFFLFLRSL